MENSGIIQAKISEVYLSKDNPQTFTKSSIEMLATSIMEFPQMLLKRPLVCVSRPEGGYIALGGNKRLRAGKKAGLKTIPIMLADDWTEGQRKEFVIKDNLSYGEWDMGLLASQWDAEVLNKWGLDVIYPDEDKHISNTHNEEEYNQISQATKWVPDCLFPSNNEFDIPTLLLPTHKFYVELPIKPWGSEKRSKQGVGTYHFYVDDYRFETIWDKPQKIIESGCKSIVEPNTSVYETTPIGYGIFLIYKKRWISRLLQDYGINVFVDLNVTEKFMPYNLMGVPSGYNAFFTRGYENRLSALQSELNIAKQISGLDNPNMVVYGGSKSVKKFCNENNLVFINNTTIDIKNG